MMEEYSGATLGTSAVFALTGIAMLVLGVLLVG
jgi:hypothetical protein